MNCPNCGRRVSVSARVCPGCGSAVADGRQPAQAAPQPVYRPAAPNPTYPTAAPQPVRPAQPAPRRAPAPRKKKPTGLILGLAGGALAIVLILVVVLLLKPKPDAGSSNPISTLQPGETSAADPNRPAQTDPAATDAKPSVQGQLGYTEKTEEFPFNSSSGSPVITNSAAYPVFDETDPAGIALNRRIGEVVDSLRTDERDMDAYAAACDAATLPHYTSVYYEVTLNRSGYISLTQVMTSYTGGAHPYRDYTGLVYAMSDSEPMSVWDFVSGSDAALEAALTEAAKKAGASFYGSVLETVLELSPFILKEDGICFLVNVGDALPRAELILPYTDPANCRVELEDGSGGQTGGQSIAMPGTDVDEYLYAITADTAIMSRLKEEAQSTDGLPQRYSCIRLDDRDTMLFFLSCGGEEYHDTAVVLFPAGEDSPVYLSTLTSYEEVVFDPQTYALAIQPTRPMGSVEDGTYSGGYAYYLVSMDGAPRLSYLYSLGLDEGAPLRNDGEEIEHLTMEEWEGFISRLHNLEWRSLSFG